MLRLLEVSGHYSCELRYVLDHMSLILEVSVEAEGQGRWQGAPCLSS